MFREVALGDEDRFFGSLRDDLLEVHVRAAQRQLAGGCLGRRVGNLVLRDGTGSSSRHSRVCVPGLSSLQLERRCRYETADSANLLDSQERTSAVCARHRCPPAAK